MFCSKCGREISNQARFCNYCGSPVAAPAVQAAQQPAPAKKTGTWGKRILTIVIAVVVYFVVRNITEYVLTGQEKASNAPTSPSSEVIEIYDSSLTDSCFYGALYQDGYLRYGMAKLYMPDYFLLPGEGDERDWLMSSDETCLFAANKQLEIIDVSFEASDEEGMLKSYTQSYSDASMVDYQKYYVNDFPVIRYIVRCTAEGTDQYVGELIVLPGETADETIRLSMYQLAESGYDEINQVFDSLDISREFAPSAEDTQVVGLNRITVK